MRTKVTLVLLFLNVVLFYYIFQFEKKWEEERRYLETRRRVLGPEVASIDSFTRTTRAGAPVRLEKRGDTWRLTQPYEWPANLNAVSSITTELNFLEHETSFAVRDLPKSRQTLADYGLAQPALTFAFTAAGKTYELKLGDDTKFGHRLYLLSPDGARIHVVSRSLTDSLGLPLENLRAESIFSIPVFEVRSLTIQTAPLKVRLHRDGLRWFFEAPILTRANKNKVDVTISALNSLQAKKFLEPRDAANQATGLDNPVLRVTLDGNTRHESLLIGNALAPAPSPTPNHQAPPPATETEYYARIEDKSVVFTVTLAPALLDDLKSAQENLRDASVLDFDPRYVTSLTLLAPNQPELTLQRLESVSPAAAATPSSAQARPASGEAWQLISRAKGQDPQKLPADVGVVQNLLQKLYLLTAKKFLSDAPSDAEVENYGFKSPAREIHLILDAAPTAPSGLRASPAEIVLQVGTSPDPDKRGLAFARLTSAPYLYQIDADILGDTPPLARHFRERLLRELPPGTKITALKLTNLATGALLLDRSLPADSTPPSDLSAKTSATADALAREDDPAPRKAALLSLLSQLRVLRAKHFVAATFNKEHAELENGSRPWKFRLDATVALVGGAGAAQTSASTLYFTDRLGGATQLAGTDEFDGGVVFAATQELLDALFALTYAPHDPGPPPLASPAAPNPAP